MIKRVPSAVAVIAIVAGAIVLATGTASAQMDDMMANMRYEVTITNLTSGQVLSPPVFVTHADDMHVWQAGQLASDEVRNVAEMGDTGPLAASLSGAATDVQALSDPLPPGQSTSVTVTAHEGDVLSALAMLVQTNDAFTGLDNLALDTMDMTHEADAYDAGTEDNTEMASDVPGPPFGGTNRVPTDPAQPIAMHSGIMGGADVGAEYAWEGSVARFTVRPMPTMMPKTGATEAPLATFGLLLGAVLATFGLALRRFGRPASL